MTIMLISSLCIWNAGDGSFYQRFPDGTSLYLRAPDGWDEYKASLPQTPATLTAEEPERMDVCEEDAHAGAIFGLRDIREVAYCLEFLTYAYAIFIASTTQTN